jgi:hypothetical protein
MGSQRTWSDLHELRFELCSSQELLGHAPIKRFESTQSADQLHSFLNLFKLKPLMNLPNNEASVFISVQSDLL